MVIGPATADDAREIAHIHVDAWRAAYAGIMPDEHLAALSVDERETMWREAIAAGRPELLVARLDGRVTGWISFDRARESDAGAHIGEVWALYLDPAHVSTGLGSALWRGAKERLVARGFRSVILWVLAGNPRAIRFYERVGFAVDPGSARLFTLGGREIEELRCTMVL